MNKSCVFCKAIPAKDALLIPCLTLLKQGFPLEVTKQDWNIINLCSICYWLYKNQLDRWVGYHLKLESGKEQVLATFADCLAKVNIIAEYPAKECQEMGIEHHGTIRDVYCTGLPGSNWIVIVTKLGSLLVKNSQPVNKKEFTKFENTVRSIWKEVFASCQLKTPYKYRQRAEELQALFYVKQKELFGFLLPYIRKAQDIAARLLAKYLVVQEITVGQETPQGKITGFDFSELRGKRRVKVYIWRTTCPGEVTKEVKEQGLKLES